MSTSTATATPGDAGALVGPSSLASTSGEPRAQKQQHQDSNGIDNGTSAHAVDDDGNPVLTPGNPIVCNGCSLSLEETSDTVVVSFGDGLWHVDCFRCAKCNNLVEHDTNLLLLGDGSPVCESCSYVCSYCGLSISNEAIVTGDESYHADCFRCKSCSTRIEELVFAKTSQGIYCMACHNERVARTRKHIESKQKDKERRNRSLRRNQRQASSSGTALTSDSSSRSRSALSSSRPDHASSTTSVSGGTQEGPISSPGIGVDDNMQNYLDTPTMTSSVPNSAALPLSGHAAHTTSRSVDHATKNGTLPNPPVSLKKLRGMDSAPRYGERADREKAGDGQQMRAQSSASASARNSPRPPDELPPSPAARTQAAILPEQSLSSSTPLPIRKPSDDALQSTSSASTRPQVRPSTSGEATSSRGPFPSLAISRSASPTPSTGSSSPVLRSTSPTSTSFSGSLSAPKASSSKNANRRSGFYGVMALPNISTSPSGSGTVTPVLADPAADGHEVLEERLGATDQDTLDSETVHIDLPEMDLENDEKALPVRPLAINRTIGQTDQASFNAASSSSLSSVNTSTAGSSSSLSAPTTHIPTPQSLSASSSSSRNNHMSFYDPDVLVFLDAVQDDPAKRSEQSTSRGASPLDHESLATPTRVPDSARSASSTTAQDGYASDGGPETTFRRERRSSGYGERSRSLSPHLEQRNSLTPSPRQPKNLNLVANGQLSATTTNTDDDEEQEHLSPLANQRRSSGMNGLGVSTSSRNSGVRSVFSVDDDEDEPDDVTKSALRKVRESIRQSRGASMASASDDCARASGMTLDVELVELLIKELEQTKNKMKALQKNYNAIRRASRQAFEGFSMAREEYDREVQARRDAEYEMMRLKKELQEQASKLGTLNEAKAQQDMLQRRSHDLRTSVVGIEQELRKMKIERDLTFAEMEELAAKKSEVDSANPAERLSVALDSRLSTIKDTYRSELEDLSRQRDDLKAEIDELKQAKDLFTEEGVELNKRNAELSEEISGQAKKLEALKAAAAHAQKTLTSYKEQASALHQQQVLASSSSPAKPREKALPPPTRSDSVPQHAKGLTSLSSSVPSSGSASAATPPPAQANLPPAPSTSPQPPSSSPQPSGLHPDAQSATLINKADQNANLGTIRKFKWGSKKGLERPLNASISKHPGQQGRATPVELSARQHNFQPTSILRPVRCEHCGDKMWGMGEQRCQACGIYCHSKCAPSFNIQCNSAVVIEEPEPRGTTMSMFGNDLVAQCLNENHPIPNLVVKCIEVVEDSGMEHEGIYRKSGGMGQTKLISACFDRGEPFDLSDQDRFNDISAVTSVLKNYFRSLPNPLFTFEFHQDFCALPTVKDSATRLSQLENLLHSLPEQHFATLRVLMLHLNRIHRSSAENKMTPANLGVVFGPTLLRSPDPSQEFSQMHLKARVVELTVENAPQLFAEPFKGT